MRDGDKEAEKTSDVGDGFHEESNRTEVNIDTRYILVQTYVFCTLERIVMKFYEKFSFHIIS